MGFMRRGWFLGAIVIAASAGTAYWAIRATEPVRRYDRIRSLMVTHRGQPSSAWSKEESKSLWDSVDWFSARHPEMLRERLSRSLASPDPVEREGALLLIDALLTYQIVFFPAIPEAPDVLPYLPRMDSGLGTAFELEKAFIGKPEVILRLSRDESALTRISLIRVAQQIVSADLDAALLRMCREDSIPSVRIHAVNAFVKNSLDVAGVKAFRDLLKTDDTALRMTVAAALAEAGDSEVLLALLRATETDTPAKAVHLLKGKIPEALFERLHRKYP